MKLAGRRWIACGALCVVVAAGCSTSDPATSVGTSPASVLTRDQANVMASMLFKNYDTGGADFTVEVAYGKAATFSFAGQIDWKKRLGHALVTTHLTDTSAAQPAPADVYWIQTSSQQVVLQGGLQNLEHEMVALGRTGIKYLARPLSEKTPQDIVLLFVNALGAAQRDNPQLLQFGDQANAAAKFVRTDKVDGAPVNVFSQKDKVRFWVRVSDGVLVKVDADLGGFSGPTVVLLKNHRSLDLHSPQASEVVDASTLPQDVIDRLFPKASAG